MRKPYIHFLFMFILLAVFFSPLLFTLRNIAGNYGDIYLHYYPLKHLVAENIISGKVPLWDPYIFAGQPLLANPQSAIFYPLSIIFCLFPLHLAFNYFIFIHFILAGIFMYVLLSYLRFSGTTSFISSITYALSSFLVYKVPAGHPAALSGYVWLPLIICLIEYMKRNESYFALILFSITLSFQFLSGHIQPIYVTLVYLFMHFLFNRFVYWKKLLYAGVLTLVICSIQLIPSLELSQVAETLNWKSLALSYSMPIKNLINMVLPDYYGNILNGSYIHQLNPSYFFELHSLYIGIIPLLLAMLGFFLYIKSKMYFWPFIALLGIFLSLGLYNPIYNVLYSFVPALSLLRVPARFSILLILALIIFMSTSFEKYVQNRNRIIKVIVILLIITDLFYWGKKFIYTENFENYRKKSEITEYISPMYRIVTEPGVLPADKSILYHHFNLNGYETIFLQDFTRYIGLQEKGIMSPTGLARTNFNSPLMKGFAVKYFVKTVPIENNNGYIDFKSGLKLYKNDKALPLAFFPKTISLLQEKTGYDQIDYLKNTQLSPEEEIIVDDIPQGFPRYTENAKILSYSQSCGKAIAQVDMKEPGTLVISEISYSGWKAWQGKDRLKIYRGNKIFKTLYLNPRENGQNNKIYLYFQPVSYLMGLYMTVFVLLFVILIFYKKINDFDKKIIN